MTALKAAQVDAFVAKPNPAQPVVLVYGADAGLVRERAEALVRASVDDLSDPFSLVRLEGDLVASEPARLVEEANTIPLFGGKRAVWVKAGARNFAPAVEALVGNASPDCRVVIEAGELRKTAPLRIICERARKASTFLAWMAVMLMTTQNTLMSSPRRRGPIIPDIWVCDGFRHIVRTRRMGPRLRGDDS